MFHLMTRSISIAHPYRDRFKSINSAIEKMVFFGSYGIYSVNVGWLLNMFFVDWYVKCLSVLVTCARKNYFDLWIKFSTCFQKAKLCSTVNFKICERIRHTINMRKSSCKVKNNVFIYYYSFDGCRIHHITNLHYYIISNREDIEFITAKFGN